MSQSNYSYFRKLLDFFDREKEFREQLKIELKEKKDKAFELKCDPHSTIQDLINVYYPEK